MYDKHVFSCKTVWCFKNNMYFCNRNNKAAKENQEDVRMNDKLTIQIAGVKQNRNNNFNKRNNYECSKSFGRSEKTLPQ